jgi:hypothetical protein
MFWWWFTAVRKNESEKCVVKEETEIELDFCVLLLSIYYGFCIIFLSFLFFGKVSIFSFDRIESVFI